MGKMILIIVKLKIWLMVIQLMEVRYLLNNIGFPNLKNEGLYNHIIGNSQVET